MAPHSSTLAWKIHGRRSLVGCRVGDDWATSLSLFTFMHWRRKWQPTPVFLPGDSQGRRSLVGCHLWGRTESDTTEAMQQQDKQNDSYTQWENLWMSLRALEDLYGLMKTHPGCLLTLRGQRIRGFDAEVKEAILILILLLSDPGKAILLSEIFFSHTQMEIIIPLISQSCCENKIG